METNFKNIEHEIKTHRTVLDSITEGVIVADQNGCLLFFNSVAANILGIGARQIKPSEWTSVYGCYYTDTTTPFPSEQLPLSKALRGERAHDQIYICNSGRPDGLYIDIAAFPLRANSGKITGGMAIFREITGDIQSKQLVKESQERAHAQFSGVPIPTFVWKHLNGEFTLVDFNKAAESFITDNLYDYLGTKLTNMLANYPDVQDDFKRCFHEKTTFNRRISYDLQGTGKQRDLIVTYVYVAPDQIMMHIEDITERVKTQNELQKYFNAVKHTADSVIITNPQGVIEYVNPAFEQTTGFSSKEAVGQTPALIRSGIHEKEFYKGLWETILSGEPFRGTIINKKKNGELFWCEQTISSMKDPRGNITHFVSVAKDITQLKEKQELEFRLRVAHELQQRLSKTTLTVEGFDIAGRTYPAVETSGDFFDIIEMPDGYVGIVIADVSGHGIGAAMIMAETRAFLRAFARIETNPAVILERLNNELVIDLAAEHFVTLVLVRLDPAKQNFVYSSAGHGKAYLLNSTGRVVSEMASTGIPLGFMPHIQYKLSKTVNLDPNDIIVLLTDGISEALSSDEIQFGDQRALAAICENREKPADQIIEQVHSRVCEHTDKQTPDDDMTTVICKMISEK